MQIEIYNKITNETVDIENDPDFKDYGVYIKLDGTIVLHQHGAIAGVANMVMYGARIKNDNEMESIKLQRDFWRGEAQKWASMLGEIKMAEAQGLITRYQCKIGDMVYEVNKNTNTVSGYIITEINTYEYGHKNVFYKWEIIEGISSGAEGFNEKELGETVFLTRQEAEKALKGGVNNADTGK